MLAYVDTMMHAWNGDTDTCRLERNASAAGRCTDLIVPSKVLMLRYKAGFDWLQRVPTIYIINGPFEKHIDILVVTIQTTVRLQSIRNGSELN